MKLHKILLLLCALLSSVVCLGDRVHLETRATIPKAWRQVERAQANSEVQLILAIKQRNLDLLEQKLIQVSDPRSALYGKHLTKAEADALVAPDPVAVQKVLDWIAGETKHARVVRQNDFVTVDLPIKEAEALIQCQFYVYQHKEKINHKLTRCASGYSVPKDVAPHLDFVGGTTHFPKIASARSNEKREAGFMVTPDILRSRYNVGDTVGKAPNNRQAVAQFLEQYADEVDLQEFFTLFYWPAVGNTIGQVIGNNSWYEPGIEASLDIQYIMSMGTDIDTWFYSVSGLHQNQEPFLAWTMILANESDADIPKVISVSYGDDEDSLDEGYAVRISNEFQKLGVRGVSILFASGDSGVSCNDAGTAFVPGFPASSPWVTAVGGTFTEDFFELGNETVNSLSGGGFSNFFAAPSYQTDAVNQYFTVAQDLPAPSFYNRSGRAYPDISALSSGFVICIYGLPMPGVSGTSCAAPTASGIFALLNDLRLQNNKSTLGFLNPLLYQHPEGFFDVTIGCNPGGCPNDGFCAAVGWDPASGVGTPMYDKLSEIVMQLP